MCFSAGASFGAGVVLTVIGSVCVKQTSKPNQLLFSSIPLIFAVQQFSEGFVWLSLTHAEFAFLQMPATFIFLLFAQVIWPFWVPIAIMYFDKENPFRTIQKILVVSGFLVSAALAYCLIRYDVSAIIIGYHIKYIQAYPLQIKLIIAILYISATILPPFFSRLKYMWLLGFTILLAYLITQLFYEQYVISVWCFLSSIISLSVLLIIHKANKSSKQNKSNELVFSLINRLG